jgi:hypothetical protein
LRIKGLEIQAKAKEVISRIEEVPGNDLLMSLA